jgi:iron complex outermembrane receptor protein
LRGDVNLLDRRLKLVGGLRVEQTNLTAEGPLTDPTLNFQRDASGRVLRGANGQPLTITTDPLGISKLTRLERGMHAEKEYFRYFPSLNASYTLRENLVARAAFYTSVGRPNFNQYAGGLTLPNIDNLPSASNRIVVNNAAIKAWSAETAKVSVEYYFEGVGLFSVGGLPA